MNGDDLGPHIEAVARGLLGEPNRALSSPTQWRYGRNGSLAVEVAGDRQGTWYDFEAAEGGGVLDLIVRQRGGTPAAAADWLKAEIGSERRPNGGNGGGERRIVVATYDYRDESGGLLFQVCRFGPEKDFRQRRPDGNGGWIWSVKGIPQIPYRLEDLANADPASPVLVVEGEKDADRLASLGVLASCNPGGASKSPSKSKWRPELNEHFRGRTVCILPDNDGPGRNHARQVAAALHGVAAEVRVVHLPGLGDKEDVSDWLDRGGTAAGLRMLCEAAPVWTGADAAGHRGNGAYPSAGAATGPDLLAQIVKATERLIATSGNPTPLPWFIERWIPALDPTLMGGPGGGGKSYLALQLQASSALCVPWLGLPVPRCRATLGFYTEDSLAAVENRLDAIARHLGTTVTELVANGMRVLPRPAETALIVPGGRWGEMTTTPAFADLRRTIDTFGAELVIIDNVADFLPVPSFDNTAIRQARRIALDLLCSEHGVTILGLQNVTLTGLRATDEAEGSSGGLAWRDAFRSRLYLRREATEADAPGADRSRTLCRIKANNAGDDHAAIRLRWADGVFVADAPSGNMIDRLEHQANDRWLMDAVARIVEGKRPYSLHKNQSDYLPKLLAAEPDRPKRFAEKSIREAFERLVHADTIRVREVDEPRKGRTRDRIVAVGDINP